MIGAEEAALLGTAVPAAYLKLGVEGVAQRTNLVAQLLHQRALPAHGWDELQIQLLLASLSAMDSNNFPERAGAGEREGRVYSRIVAQRHFGLAHGIGRSGELTEAQVRSAAMA